MSLIATLRNRQTIRARIVIVVFAVLWSSLLLQSCVMVAPTPSDPSQHGSTHAAGRRAQLVVEQGDGQNDCPHRSFIESDCCNAEGICSESDALKRSVAVKVKDDSSEPIGYLLPIRPESDQACQLILSSYFSDAEPRPPGPPLNIWNCVFLL